MNTDTFFGQIKEIIHKNFFIDPQLIANRPFDLEIRCFSKVIAHVYVSFVGTGVPITDKLIESDLQNFENDIKNIFPESHFSSILQFSSSQPIVFEVSLNTKPPVPPSIYQLIQYGRKIGDNAVVFGVDIPLQKSCQLNSLLQEGTFVKKQRPYQILFNDPEKKFTLLPPEEPARLPQNFSEVLQELQREKERNPEFIQGQMRTPLSFDENEMKKQLLSFAEFVRTIECASFVPLTDAQVQEIPVWESHINTTGLKTLEKIRKWETDTRQFFCMNDGK